MFTDSGNASLHKHMGICKVIHKLIMFIFYQLQSNCVVILHVLHALSECNHELYRDC